MNKSPILTYLEKKIGENIEWTWKYCNYMLYYNLLAAGIYKICAVPQIASGFSFGYRRSAVFPAFRYMHDCYRVSIAKFKIFDKPVMHFRFNVGKCSKIFQCAVRKIKIPLCIPAGLFVFRTAAGNEKRYFRCQIFASPYWIEGISRDFIFIEFFQIEFLQVDILTCESFMSTWCVFML